MGRNFQIFGQTMVFVQGGNHLSGRINFSIISGRITELGLSVDQIEVKPRFIQHDMMVDDFGPNIPPEIMNNMSDATVRMTLIHYDETVMDLCIAESMGGVAFPDPPPIPFVRPQPTPGILPGAGAVMGNGLPLYASGNHYIQLTLKNVPPDASQPYNYVFPSAYLDSQPVVIPIGTKASQVVLNWRVIPYKPIYQSGGSLASGGFLIEGIVYTGQEIRSSGAVLWYRV